MTPHQYNPPAGHEILPAPFLRQHGAQRDMKFKRQHPEAHWHSSDLGPEDNHWWMSLPEFEADITNYIWCAPIGTMAATTPLPVRCVVSLGDLWAGGCAKCGKRGEWGIASQKGPEGCKEATASGEVYCLDHLPQPVTYRHILPGALAALAEKPEGLIWATSLHWLEKQAGKVSIPPNWDTMHVDDFDYLKDKERDDIGDFAYAIPAPLEKGENHMSRAILDQLEPGAFEEPRWHNPDNLASAGEPPWRFFISGETIVSGDDCWTRGVGWTPIAEWGVKTNPYPYADITYRTRRPLPAPSVPAGQKDEWKPINEAAKSGDWVEIKYREEGGVFRVRWCLPLEMWIDEKQRDMLKPIWWRKLRCNCKWDGGHEPTCSIVWANEHLGDSAPPSTQPAKGPEEPTDEEMLDWLEKATDPAIYPQGHIMVRSGRPCETINLRSYFTGWGQSLRSAIAAAMKGDKAL